MRAKKPKILSQKIKLAEIIREKCPKRNYHRHGGGYSWKGYFMVDKRELYIYFQLYVRKRGAVDFIHLRWIDNDKSLTITEINGLINHYTANEIT